MSVDPSVDPIIVSPSYKRAGKVEIRKYLPDVTLAVHEFEAAEYEQKSGGEIAVMPDALRGNMAKVRNWILNRFGDRNLVMMDDDVEYVGRFRAGRPLPVTADHFRELLDVGFGLAEDSNTYLWGINLVNARQAYREYSPLSFLCPVLGPFSCIRPNPLRYDERLGLKEDYDYALQHLHRYRRILRLNMYFYLASHLDRPGGCAAYRLMDEERRQLDLMKQKWGDAVRFDLARSQNPILCPPLKGI